MIRVIEENDANRFLEMLLTLDSQTKYMMFEVGERNTDVASIVNMINSYNRTQSLLLVAKDNGEIVGFLSAQKGQVKRTKHNAYIVIGILQSHHKKGIGSELFAQLERWAKQQQIKRLELTVMTHNQPAVHLYKKFGFEIEGTKKNAMIVDGVFVDEYYMAKLYQ